MALTAWKQRVFLGKVRDLAFHSDPVKALESPDAPYHALMAAPLLRELLIGASGAPRLVDVVNDPQLAIVCFTIKKPGDLPVEVDFRALMNGIDPEFTLNKTGVTKITLGEFLAMPVVWVRGVAISIEDVIDYAANFAGGVHFGDLRRPNRELLREFSELPLFGQESSYLLTLSAIGRITVAGLQPLYTATINQLRPLFSDADKLDVFP